MTIILPQQVPPLFFFFRQCCSSRGYAKGKNYTIPLSPKFWIFFFLNVPRSLSQRFNLWKTFSWWKRSVPCLVGLFNRFKWGMLYLKVVGWSDIKCDLFPKSLHFQNLWMLPFNQNLDSLFILLLLALIEKYVKFLQRSLTLIILSQITTLSEFPHHSLTTI